MLPPLMRHALASIALLALAACDRRISAEECTRMLDKYLDMTVPDEDLRSMPPEQAAPLRDGRKSTSKAHPAYRATQAQCEAQVSRRQFECAMATHNADEWQACVD